MSEVQQVHDILQTEIEYAALQHGLSVSFSPVQKRDAFGFIVNEGNTHEVFVIICYFRIGPRGGVEFAVYNRNNFEMHESEKLCWIPFDKERISIVDIFLDAYEIFADEEIH